LTVIRIGFEIRFLDLVANEFRVARHELGLDEFEVALFDFLRKLLAAYRMLKHKRKLLELVNAVEADHAGRL
jgi:hypothetical protein